MLLDSNILIYAVNLNDPKLNSILNQPNHSISSISQIEILGYHRLGGFQKQWLSNAMSVLNVLPIDESVVATAIALRQAKKMKLGDVIIAATALTHNLTLITRNTVDFKHVPGLQLLNPFAP